MAIKLSKSSIESYAGNVLPLRLISDENIETANINWSVQGDSVTIRTFEDDADHPFRDGVLIRFIKTGNSTVLATLNGERFECAVSVREMKKASSEDELNYYRGDLHTHTTGIHNRADFMNRTEGFQSDMVNFIKEEGLLDLGVMTDHGDVSTQYEYFRCYTTVEDAEPMNTVMFPGCESDNIIMKTDMEGREYRAAGEVIVINGDSNKSAYGWEDLVSTFKDAPCPIGIFAHPVQASWEFEFERHGKDPEITKLMRCVEMGDGRDTNCRILHEYALSSALDAGFRVTSSCGSDGHARWGFAICPGKTIIMAAEKSKEAFTDALRNNRAYASDSGNVKLKLRVNGKAAPCDLPLTDKYSFNVSLAYFADDDSTKIVKCQVISDYGNVVFEKKGITDGNFSFDIASSTARYFYLRLVDNEGRRTFSPPVWCGREFDEFTEPSFKRIESKDFKAVDTVSGKDATALLNFDVKSPWENGEKTASIVIDMQKEETISALVYVNPTQPAKKKDDPLSRSRFHVKCPRRYKVSTSLDGEQYTLCAEGGIRKFGSEEIISFDEINARYVKFDVLSTVGLEFERKEYLDSTLLLGGLIVMKKG